MLDETLTDPVIAANRGDLDWIEERLGMSVLDATPQSDCDSQSPKQKVVTDMSLLNEAL